MATIIPTSLDIVISFAGEHRVFRASLGTSDTQLSSRMFTMILPSINMVRVHRHDPGRELSSRTRISKE